jgi:predicted ArsR family transcriptional regulator
MRDVGLLQIDVETRGEVGRPQHRYSLAPDAPSLGLEPPSTTLLSTMLLRLVELAGVNGADAAEIGRAQGAADAAAYRNAPSSLEALVSQHDRIGFDPVVTDGEHDDSVVVAFAHCPFRSFAETNPDVVCSLHRGLVEGFLDRMGDTLVSEFCSLAHRTPCQVAVSTR